MTLTTFTLYTKIVIPIISLKILFNILNKLIGLVVTLTKPTSVINLGDWLLLLIDFKSSPDELFILKLSGTI